MTNKLFALLFCFCALTANAATNRPAGDLRSTNVLYGTNRIISTAGLGPQTNVVQIPVDNLFSNRVLSGSVWLTNGAFVDGELRMGAADAINFVDTTYIYSSVGARLNISDLPGNLGSLSLGFNNHIMSFDTAGFYFHNNTPNLRPVRASLGAFGGRDGIRFMQNSNAVATAEDSFAAIGLYYNGTTPVRGWIQLYLETNSPTGSLRLHGLHSTGGMTNHGVTVFPTNAAPLFVYTNQMGTNTGVNWAFDLTRANYTNLSARAFVSCTAEFRLDAGESETMELKVDDDGGGGAEATIDRQALHSSSTSTTNSVTIQGWIQPGQEFSIIVGGTGVAVPRAGRWTLH